MAAVVWRDLLTLAKPRIGLAIALAAAAGLALAKGPLPDAATTLGLILAVLLAASAAAAFNHYVERDLDRRMARTRTRPFAAGRLPAHPLWLVGFVLLALVAVGWAGFLAGPLVALFVFAGAFTYAIIYTLALKRRTPWNIVVGGLAGSFAVLAGGAAAGVGFEVLALALVLFLWTPPHFWSLAMAVEADYAAAGVPMLPLVVGRARCARIILAHVAALVLLALLPVLGQAGRIYFGAALLGGGWFLWEAMALCRHPGRRRALRTFFASLGQLGLLLGGAVADRLVVEVLP